MREVFYQLYLYCEQQTNKQTKENKMETLKCEICGKEVDLSENGWLSEDNELFCDHCSKTLIDAGNAFMDMAINSEIFK